MHFASLFVCLFVYFHVLRSYMLLLTGQKMESNRMLLRGTEISC